MAIKSNSSDKAVVRERQLYVGPCLVNVVLVNPNLTDLTEAGYNFEKDPEYLSTEEDGTKKVRIDFYVQNKDFKNKVTFFLADKERTNKNGDKFEFVNNAGQNTWCATVEEAVEKEGKNGNKFFKPEGARKALIGETDFYNFIKTWANVEPGEDCSLEDIKALFKGNFKELQGLVKLMANNSLWIMVEVNEKGYQNINNKCFGRATSKQFPNYFSKFAIDQKNAGYPLKSAWSVEFKEYVAKAVSPDSEPTTKSEPEVEF
jgi:hypothetical protein